MPKILIVAEKLLAGYDAPILYCMYLDKPMRDHVLLQTIARVNCPYEEEGKRKTAGLIVDFVGIFDNLERALAFDSKDVAGVIEGLDVLKERFRRLMDEALHYLTLGQGKPEDKAVEEVLEFFRDQQEREEFYKFFREVESVYEILPPDPEPLHGRLEVDGARIRRAALYIRALSRMSSKKQPKRDPAS